MRGGARLGRASGRGFARETREREVRESEPEGKRQGVEFVVASGKRRVRKTYDF